MATDDSALLKIELPFVKQRMTLSFKKKNCLKFLKFIISQKLLADFEQINFKAIYKHDKNKSVDLPLDVPIRYIDEFAKFPNKEHVIRIDLLYSGG